MKHKKQEWFGAVPDLALEPEKAAGDVTALNTKRKLPRFPKSLSRRLRAALNRVKWHIRHLGIQQSWGELLDSYRAFAPLKGTDRDGFPSRGPLYPHFLRSEISDPIARAVFIRDLEFLDVAVAEAQHYRPERELTEGMFSAVGHFIRSGNTDPDTPVAEDLLLKMGILTAPRGGNNVPGSQGWIREQVRLKTGLSERTINGMAAKIRKQAKLQKGIATA